MWKRFLDWALGGSGKKFEPRLGSHIVDVSRDMIATSNETGKDVTFEFNGVSIKATPNVGLSLLLPPTPLEQFDRVMRRKGFPPRRSTWRDRGKGAA